MKNYSFTDDEISLDFEGSADKYESTWSISFVSETILRVKYTVNPPIIGGFNERLTVFFNDVTAFSSINSILISNGVIFEYEFEKVEDSAEVEGAGSGATFIFVATLGASIIFSVITGESMELMWSFANTLQILFFLGLLNLYYPSNLLTTLSYMEYANFDSPLSEYLTQLFVDLVNLELIPINSDFKTFGFDSTTVISNSFAKILLILALI